MKRNLYLAMSAVGASLLAFSCTSEILEDPEQYLVAPEGTTEVSVVAKAVVPDYAGTTKVEFGAGDAQTWAASGETLTIIPDAGGTSYSFTGGGSGTSASFDGSLGASPSGDYYAVYPSTASTSKGAVVLDNSAAQDGTTTQKTFMWGVATYNAGTLDFGTFSHLGSVMKLGLDFTAATSVAADSQIDFTMTVYNVTTSVTVDLTASPSPSYDSVTKGNLTVNVSNLQLSGKRGYVYIRLLPGDALANSAVKVQVGSEVLSCYINSGSSALTAQPVTYGKLYKANKNLILEEPFFYGSSTYGIYDLESKTILKSYTKLTDQIQRETGTDFTFRIVNANTNQYVEVSSVPLVISEGDVIASLSLKHNCIEDVSTSSSASARVNTISGNTVWIVDENGLGYIIKK